MSKDKDDDKKKSSHEQHHTGSIASEDTELTLWLNRLWAREEPPERAELWQMFGRNKIWRGEMIFHEDFKFGEKLDIEKVNRLAHEILSAAQNDCDSLRHTAWYQLAIIDRNRKANPLVRRIGPLEPKRANAMTRLGTNELEDEDEDAPRDAQAVNLAQIREGFNHLRWERQSVNAVLGQLLMRYEGLVTNLQAQNDQLRTRETQNHEVLQSSLDRSSDRKMREAEHLWRLELKQEAVRWGKNLLPGLFAAKAESTPNAPANGTNGNGNGAPKDYGRSPERMLVDNFVCDVEKNEPLMIALFGNFEEQDGKWVQTKPGIFSLKQFKILMGVRDGRLPPEALDPLMPDSGHPEVITQEQIVQAMNAGVTEGIGSAIFELVALRKRAREAKEAQVVDASAPNDELPE